MLKDLVLLGIGSVFGLGATLMGVAAPLYFKNVPLWIWHWSFWGGCVLLGLMVIDGLVLLAGGRAIVSPISALLANIGVLFIASAVIWQTTAKHLANDGTQIAPINPLDFTIALVCEGSKKNGIEPNDKKLNLIYISAPNDAPLGSDLLYWLSSQYSPPSKQTFDWSQSIKGQLYRCSFFNQSIFNVSRISIDLHFQLRKAVIEGNTNTAAEVISEGTFPVEYTDVPANSRNNHFYITNAGETWLTVIKPSVAKIMKPGSNVWEEVKLMDLGGRPDHRFSLVPANVINPPAAPLPSPALPTPPAGTSPQTSP